MKVDDQVPPRQTTHAEERRPALDGLRAVAVGLVIAFHCGVGLAEGGFVGVDVFFVLSGYLVTGVLLRAHEQDGRIHLARFYSRRVRRLLPAAVATLLATVAVFSVLVSSIELEAVKDAARASLLYVANWFFIGESTDYFADDVNRNPLLHMWSLAVEEQFYLLWPIMLSAVLAVAGRFGRRPLRVAAVVTAVGAAASLAAAIALRNTSPSRAYFGTDTRAYQLLAGALVALVPGVIARARRRPERSSFGAMLALGAVCFIATSFLDVGPIVRGVLTTGAALAVIVGIEAAPTGVLARVLSFDPIVYLGQISYGTYLWHWPVVIALDVLVDVGAPARLVAVTVLSCALAALSHRLLETPVRTWHGLDRVPGGAVVGAGVAISVLAAIVIVPQPSASGTNGSELGTATGLTPVPADLDVLAVKDARYGRAAKCVDKAPDACVMVEGGSAHLMLMGNSNAEMLVPAFVSMAEKEGFTLSVAIVAGCPWPLGAEASQPERRELCRSSKNDFYERLVPTLDPDVIFVASNIYGGILTGEMDAAAREVSEGANASVPLLTGDGKRRVVLIDPIPTAGSGSMDPLSCLDRAAFVEECRFTDRSRGSWYRRLLRDLADRDDAVSLLSIERLVCPLAPTCDPMVDGEVVFWDEGHITAAWSESMADDLTVLLRGHGLLPT